MSGELSAKSLAIGVAISESIQCYRSESSTIGGDIYALEENMVNNLPATPQTPDFLHNFSSLSNRIKISCLAVACLGVVLVC
jgi:hypothetical protein